MQTTSFVSALILVATATPTLASAETYDPYASPPVSTDRGFMAVGLELRMHSVDIATQLITLDGGYRLGDSPLIVRGALGFGGYRDNDTTSSRAIEARVGIEADTCTSGRGACAFVGLDVGYLWGHHTSRNGPLPDGPMMSVPSGWTHDDSKVVVVGRAVDGATVLWVAA